MAVQVAPACLHHSDVWIGEVMDGTSQKIAGRNKIGVEDGDQLAGGGLHACL